MLSTNIRNHILIFNDGNTLSITKAQAEFYESEIGLKKHNEFIKIIDVDTGETLFNGRCSEIKKFEEKKIYKGNRQVICSFGIWHKHLLYPSNCTCKKEFDCLGCTFKDRLKEMGYKVLYSEDITNEMRTAYKQKYFNN